ncbi:histidine kinase [Streptomyces virens]|uniref:histidine kinase n=2 Tax=Streptomyces TaxID=1883 RepID=A0A514JT28_9ACTN|nr:two-component sensor histidine kinase [Streptomyces sp. SID7804]QDI70092.1 two-component sensor histidine kinase [Streptomyces calvus]GGP38737.1 two-component sensor histidine kinase [Streptomyces calvus]
MGRVVPEKDLPEPVSPGTTAVPRSAYRVSVTETTHTRSRAATPAAGARTRSPEYRLAQDALSGLRQDLFHDAFAYRPLPRRHTDGPFVRRLPGRLRRAAEHLPHAVVGAVALIACLAGAVGGGLPGGDVPALLSGLMCALPVLATLIRPVGAFWLSLAVTPVVAILNRSGGDWPWMPGAFVCHLAVLVVVALRTRPRTAAWMWVLTAAYAFLSDIVFSGAYYYTNSGPMMVTSAFALLVVSLWHVRHTAQQEVTAQQTVTAHERSRRTALEERTTIARELHDVVAHHMSVVAIQAEAAPYRVENPPPELERAFATIRENAVAALTELRRILGVVRAEDYEAPDSPQPTLADLDALLVNVRDAGLDVEKVVTGAVRELPQGVELSAYRIVQEALSNSLRHAPGASARVEIGYVLGGLGVRVVNGPMPRPTLVKPARHPATTPEGALRPPSPLGAGHGITGMRERVTMLNGEMTAGPTDDGGYEIAVFLPVTAVNEGDA